MHPFARSGTWQLLRQGESLKLDAPRPVDLSPECCALLENLMLAQAQVRCELMLLLSYCAFISFVSYPALL